MNMEAYKTDDIKNVIDDFIFNGYQNKVFTEEMAQNVSDYFNARGVECTDAKTLIEQRTTLTQKIANYAKQTAEQKLKAEAKMQLKAAAKGEELPDIGAR